MPVWLLKMLLSIAISLLTRKLGSLETMKHVQNALAKATPLKPDSNPPPMQGNNPNMKNHFGGL